MGLRRTRFFGRNVVSLLILLPIALPGIVTGLAFQNGFRTILGIDLSLWTIVIAHATFCIVTVFNNVQARFARLGGNFEHRGLAEVEVQIAVEDDAIVVAGVAESQQFC